MQIKFLARQKISALSLEYDYEHEHEWTRNLCFVIHSSFVIRASSFFSPLPSPLALPLAFVRMLA